MEFQNFDIGTTDTLTFGTIGFAASANVELLKYPNFYDRCPIYIRHNKYNRHSSLHTVQHIAIEQVHYLEVILLQLLTQTTDSGGVEAGNLYLQSTVNIKIQMMKHTAAPN